MKSKIRFFLNFAFTLSFANIYAQTTYTVSIAAANAQVITGWGGFTEQCGTNNVTGPLAYDAMFNELGLSISRFRLWAHCASDNKGNINTGSNTIGLDHIYYVWNEGKKRGITDWYMSVWEVPKGMDSTGGKLLAQYESVYCTYVVNCLNYLINTKGMPVPKGFCIANEPVNTAMQTYAQMVRVTKAMRVKFNTCGINNIKSIPIMSNDAESFATFGSWYGYNLTDTSYWNSVGINSCHSYYHAGTANPAAPDQFLTAVNKYGPSKQRWMTENCSATNPQSSQLLRAITMGQQLAHDINYCGFNVWMWWSVWDPGFTSSFGSINATNSNVLIDGNGSTVINRSKLFYLLAKLWNSAKPGSIVHKVTCTDPAFKSAGGFFDDGAAFVYNGATVVLLINNSASPKTYTIKGLTGNSASIYQTNSTQDMALVSSPAVSAGTITGYTLPAQSISVVITSVTTSVVDADNEIENILIYPNPVNDNTIIHYSLTNNSDVKISVYDITGRVIANIAEEKQAVGIHDISFDTGELQSGIYFIQVSEGDKQRIQKFVKK